MVIADITCFTNAAQHYINLWVKKKIVIIGKLQEYKRNKACVVIGQSFIKVFHLHYLRCIISSLGLMLQSLLALSLGCGRAACRF